MIKNRKTNPTPIRNNNIFIVVYVFAFITAIPGIFYFSVGIKEIRTMDSILNFSYGLHGFSLVKVSL
jgi:hypothetical protein